MIHINYIMGHGTDDGTHGFRGGFISHPDALYYMFSHCLPKREPTYLSTDPPTYRISYLPMCFFSYLPGSCTYFLISCFLTTHLTYLLTISLKNDPLPTYLPTCLPTSLSICNSTKCLKINNGCVSHFSLAIYIKKVS